MTEPDGLRRLEARGHWGIKCGLENIRSLLARLDHPERACPVVLIAGTNGKGSTGAFLAHALRAAGRRVGWTTSPHLRHPRERIWVDGACLEPAELEGFLEEVFRAEAALGLRATYFELMIAAAFLAFRAARLDGAVVEVGMGGRWDATNASDPVLTVLTNVERDHMQYLGSTREAIGREKLCTARHGRPLVLGPRLDPAWIWPLLECRPVLHPAPALRAEHLAWDHSRVAGHRVPLAGAHQLENLATALEALRCLGVPEAAAWRGVEATRWPGRLWAVPGLDGVTLDGAHNLDGARRLAEHALATGTRPHLFFSAMGDKDLAGMRAELERLAPVSLTLVHGENPRYATPEALREIWGTRQAVLDIATAAARLREPADGPRLVCGSLYFIGDLLGALGVDPARP
ncbi:bifunctional folylpolyglutamate synthase/dihydrofolate synthase [Mesoterricola sediminis]|uniref:Folyl-polyglutamate synthetase n=1 Tax=Mesoterricola sediminis TaxID=2927980 RepID=A0AA48H074_9BACT|nr:Mur ligase family protein [Mesoterricola sediminis]BDU78835.1 folyl-polyglutamate synthetase [Mesoterricola sediminis]